MDAIDPISVEICCQSNGNKLDPHRVSRIIALQHGWRADRHTAKPEEGFLATEFAAEEVRELYAEGGTFFLLQRAGEVVGFALTTAIGKFTEQYDGPDLGHLRLTEALDLPSFVYLYQAVIQKGEQQRGLGRQLMRHVLRHHGQPMLADVLTAPVPNLGSIRFFARLGFKKVGDLTLGQYRDYGALTSDVLVFTGSELP